MIEDYDNRDLVVRRAFGRHHNDDRIRVEDAGRRAWLLKHRFVEVAEEQEPRRRGPGRPRKDGS